MNDELKRTIKDLKQLEQRSYKSGYKGDATGYAFQRHVLEMLEEQKKSNVNVLLKRLDKQEKKTEKLNRELDFYIKEYPEQLEKLEKQE